MRAANHLSNPRCPVCKALCFARPFCTCSCFWCALDLPFFFWAKTFSAPASKATTKMPNIAFFNIFRSFQNQSFLPCHYITFPQIQTVPKPRFIAVFQEKFAGNAQNAHLSYYFNLTVFQQPEILFICQHHPRAPVLFANSHRLNQFDIF